MGGILAGKGSAAVVSLLGLLLGQPTLPVEKTLISLPEAAFQPLANTDSLPMVSLDDWKTINAKAVKEPLGVNGGEKVAVRFEPAPYSKIVFEPTSPLDWSAAGGLKITLTNRQSHAVTFGIRVDDDKNSNGYLHCRTAAGVISASSTQTFEVPLGANIGQLGLKQLSYAKNAKTVSVTGQGEFDMSHIYRWQLFLASPPATTFLDIESVELTPKVSFDGFADAFGQNSLLNFPGKVRSSEELKRDSEKQEGEGSAPAAFDKYGGWAAGPGEKSSGFFGTAEVNGKWALIDPLGKLFFSVGMNTVDSGEYKTKIAGRENLFVSIPKEGDSSAGEFYTDAAGKPNGNLFNFYRYNLSRKFGPTYEAKWRSETVARLKNWGFNTIGGFSDKSFYSVQKMPYTASEGIYGEVSKIKSGEDHWGPFPDPFDPRFEALAKARLPRVTEKCKDDPYCLGYFIDNELAWGSTKNRYGLARGALSQSAEESPAKRVFVTQLKAKYGNVESLNRSWGTRFVNWTSVSEPVTLSESRDLGGDFSVFVSTVAEKYFKTIRDEVKRVDPHHLYLGCRFSGFTPEVMAMAEKYCDVISLNVYQETLNTPEFSFIKELRKPVIISEFHFGASDRGVMGSGLVAAADQEDRGAKYKEYIGSALRNPNVVGCHWFQLVDQPLTGRALDGENFNIGFVSVVDRPYPELVDAAKAINSRIYSERFTR